MLRSLKRRKSGFSLVEVLIAIAIIAVVVIPLAMTLISSARMNHKARRVSAANDVSTSIIETLQTVDLGDIMIELNSSLKGDGAPSTEKDEYYGDVSKALLKALEEKGFEVSDISMYETKKLADGSYQKITDKSKSSVLERVFSDNSVKNYFVGQSDDKYSFLLKGVKNGEMTIDVVADIEGLQSYDLVSITSMSHSDVFYVKQPVSNGKSTMEVEAAEKFLADHQLYGQITGQPDNYFKDLNWFLNNMERKIVVDIVRDSKSEAVTVEISAEYYLENNDVLQKSDQKIVKSLGSFSTNSTAELAKGIHVYFNPLNNAVNKSQRDTLVVNNKNDVRVPVFFVALDQDASLGFNKLNYKPSLIVKESSGTGASATIVCTNLINSKEDIANKLNVVSGQKDLTIKTIGNATTQQVLYSISLQVYDHEESSYVTTTQGSATEEKFTPRKKDLLSEVEGTFIDTSEKIDTNVSSDDGDGAFAYANGIRRVYDGTLVTGVDYRYVDISGTTQAINAGKYTVVATPKIGRTWADGTNEPKTITWEITRAPTTKVILSGDGGQLVYNAQEQNGFATISGDLKNSEDSSLKPECFTGTYKAVNAGTYTASFTPDSNHCWEDDGTISVRTFTWTINKRPLTVTWPTGQDKDRWVYDGTTHTIQPKISGIISGDACSISLKDNFIKDVGEKTAVIAALTNNNYVVSENREHLIKVTANKSAFFELKTDTDGNPYLTYNGEAQNIVLKHAGVRFKGDVSAKNAGTYTVIIEPMEGYAWNGAEDDFSPVRVEWKILPKEVSFNWGDNGWVYAPQKFGYYLTNVGDDTKPKTYQREYDGRMHQISCEVRGVIGEDVCTAILENDTIQNEGVVTTKVVDLSNKNYYIPADDACLIEITPKSVADVINYAPAEKDEFNRAPFEYNGKEQTGIVGTCVDMTGTYKATDVCVDYDNQVVSCHKAYVTPKLNYSWGPTYWENRAVKVLDDKGNEFMLTSGLPVGSKYTLVLEWKILPIEDAWYEDFIVTYTGTDQNGVSLNNADLLLSDDGTYGITKSAVGNYIARIRPSLNHAWESKIQNGRYDVREIDVNWSIVRSAMDIPVLYGDTPVYNGKYQYPNILVFSEYDKIGAAVTFSLYKGGINDPNRTLMEGNCSYVPKAIDAGTYTLHIKINDDSFKWLKKDGTTTTEDVVIEWKILPKEIAGWVERDYNIWTYDNREFTGTAHFKDGFLCYNEATGRQDTCDFIYSNNKHTNAGDYKFSITGVTNPNYTAHYNSNGSLIYNGNATGLEMNIKRRKVSINWTASGTEHDYRDNKDVFRNNGQYIPSINYNYEGYHTPNPNQTHSLNYSGGGNQTGLGPHTVTVNWIDQNPENYELASDSIKTWTFYIWRKADECGNLKSFDFNGAQQSTYATGSRNAISIVSGGTYKNAGGYTAQVNNRSDLYYFWDYYGDSGSRNKSWNIYKLSAAKVPWNKSNANTFYGDVDINEYNRSTYRYGLKGFSINDIIGTPKVSYATSAGHSYTVSYNGNYANAYAVETTGAFMHGGTYKVVASFAGDSNMSACSRTYTVVMRKINKPNNDSILSASPDSVANKGAHIIVNYPSNINGNYSYVVGARSCYQVPLKTKGSYVVTWSYAGNNDFNADSGSFSTTVHADSSPGFATYDYVKTPTVWKTEIGHAMGIEIYPAYNNCSADYDGKLIYNAPMAVTGYSFAFKINVNSGKKFSANSSEKFRTVSARVKPGIIQIS